MKDKELQEFYEEQFTMFATKGWNDFIEDLQELYTAVDDLTSVENEQTLWFRKGQLDVIQLILDRKASCERVWSDLNGA